MSPALSEASIPPNQEDAVKGRRRSFGPVLRQRNTLIQKVVGLKNKVAPYDRYVALKHNEDAVEGSDAPRNAGPSWKKNRRMNTDAALLRMSVDKGTSSPSMDDLQSVAVEKRVHFCENVQYHPISRLTDKQEKKARWYSHEEMDDLRLDVQSTIRGDKDVLQYLKDYRRSFKQVTESCRKVAVASKIEQPRVVSMSGIVRGLDRGFYGLERFSTVERDRRAYSRKNILQILVGYKTMRDHKGTPHADEYLRSKSLLMSANSSRWAQIVAEAVHRASIRRLSL